VSAKYSFKILTPIEKKLDAEVVSIVAPGESGYLGVLANHAPLITTLREGHLRVSFDGKPDRTYRIAGGILKVLRNEAVLLTEKIEEESPAHQ
jgi:F-type H+-transporting ATPase subunit epsilon